MFSSYRDLTRPIPPKHNLLDAVNSAALSLCDTCRIALSNRAQAKNKSISTPYEIFDTFPEFPRLKKSSKEARCGLCRAIRDQLLRTWAARPMEEWGVGPLSERSGIFDELLSAPWDRSVRISKLTWVLEPQPDIARVTHESESDSHPGAGVITNMSVEFGPATTAVNEHGDPLHENISQTMSFKVFDSIGKKAIPYVLGYGLILYADLDAPKPLARRLPSTAALSEENIGVMKDWIRDCQEHHRVCNESLDTADPEWIPTRLLYVGSSAADDLPRIVEKDTLIKASTATTADSDSAVQRRRVQFAALSHMWGDVDMAPPTQALHSNYEQMKRDLPTSRLSQNFRDAVETCRRLGLQYIWIDSLCIIQDSNSDWELEAGSMHMVYQYAVVTIVAFVGSAVFQQSHSANHLLPEPLPRRRTMGSCPETSRSSRRSKLTTPRQTTRGPDILSLSHLATLKKDCVRGTSTGPSGTQEGGRCRSGACQREHYTFATTRYILSADRGSLPRRTNRSRGQRTARFCFGHARRVARQHRHLKPKPSSGTNTGVTPSSATAEGG